MILYLVGLSLAVHLIGYSQPLAAFCATGCQYSATVGGCHSGAKTMLVFAFPVRGLIGPFHDLTVLIFPSKLDCKDKTKKSILQNFCLYRVWQVDDFFFREVRLIEKLVDVGNVTGGDDWFEFRGQVSPFQVKNSVFNAVSAVGQNLCAGPCSEGFEFCYGPADDEIEAIINGFNSRVD